MSTEARWLIRDRDSGGRGQKNEGVNTHTNPEDRGSRGPLPEQWKCYGSVPTTWSSEALSSHTEEEFTLA